MASDFKNLVVWQKSMDLTCAIYDITKKLPPEERYSLSDQMRRAAVSIPSNIAEGQGRDSNNELYRFLHISHGSLKEPETQLLICDKLGYIDQSDFYRCMSLIVETGKLLGGLILKIKSNIQNKELKTENL